MGEIRKYKDKHGAIYYKNRITIHDEYNRELRIMLPEKFKTRNEALFYEEQYKAKYDKSNEGPQNYSVEEYLSFWLEQHRNHVKIKTANTYAGLIRTRVIPILGNIKINKLNAAHIMQFYNELSKELSPKTIKHIHACLHKAFENAIDWKFINLNPLDRIRSPRIPQKEMLVIEDMELKMILDDLKKHESHIIFYMLAMTGARAGEIVALKRKNIDFKNYQVYIENSYNREEAFNGTKTSSSRRTVTMLDDMETVLRDYFRRKSVINNEYAFTWRNGRLFDVSYLGKRLKKSVKKLGLNPKYTLHSLRHTHATSLLKQGINPKVVSERLGHSSVNMTLDKYSHVTPTIQREALKNVKIISRQA